MSCIEETITFIEDGSIEELEDDPFPSSETTLELKPLPSILKYAFLDHQRVKKRDYLRSCEVGRRQLDGAYRILRGLTPLCALIKFF